MKTTEAKTPKTRKTKAHKKEEMKVNSENPSEPQLQTQDSPAESQLSTVQMVLLIAAIVFVLFNQYSIYTFTQGGVSGGSGASGVQLGQGASQDEIINLVISRGVPKYGQELGVSFEDPVGSLDKLAAIERKIQVTEETKQRYISIESKISCEYCCGAPSVIDKSGRSACGCSHAAALRGLGMYLLNYHATEYTDDQILEELGKWKALWFPKQVVLKALSLQAAGQPVDVISATSNMVKVSANGQVSKDIAGLPDMVGGC